MGKFVISQLTGIKFSICKVTFFKSLLPLKHFGMDGFHAKTIYHVRSWMRQILIVNVRPLSVCL